MVLTSVYQKWISEDQNQNQNFHPEIGRHLAEQNSARILVNSYQNSGGIPVVLAQTGTSGGLLAYITGDSGQDTWHGISRYWTQRPATLGARTQDGFSQAFRCPAAVCWPSPCAVLALYSTTVRVQDWYRRTESHRGILAEQFGPNRPELPPVATTVRCTLLAEFYQKPMTRSQQDFSCTGRIRQNSARTSTCTGTVLC